MTGPTAAAGQAEQAGRVILVTGMSGAGRMSCLRILEDHGFEAIDNPPLALIPALCEARSTDHDGQGQTGRIAIGVDSRTRGFAAERLLQDLEDLRARGIPVAMAFIDCSSEVLVRRFTETRRRHPLAAGGPVAEGIRAERRLFAPIRDSADLLVDSSELSLLDFRRTLIGGLGLGDSRVLTVIVTSFGFRNGLPRQADLVFDVRFLRNPYYDPALRSLDGRDNQVADHVHRDSDFDGFFDRLTGFLGPLLPRYTEEGKSYLTVAIGCTGGRHRSVCVAEDIAKWLRKSGHDVTLQHRDLDVAAIPDNAL